MTTKENRKLAERRLFEAGYGIRVGGDGLAHIQILSQTKYGPRVLHGQRAVCGSPARLIDYDKEAEPCQDCLREVLQPDGEGGGRLITATELVEMRQVQND